MHTDTTSPTVDSGPSTKPSAAGHTGLTAWQYFSFGVIHTLATWLLACVSLPGLYRFGCLFGTVEWVINYKRRRRFVGTLQRVLGREPNARERRRITREFFIRTRCDKLLYLVIDCISRDDALALLTIDNKALLDDAVGRRRGVYFALSHHGAHHVVGMLMALKGYKTAGVRDRREGAIRRYVQDRFDRRYPEFQRTHLLFADRYPREIYRCLQDGFLLASAMDVSRVRDPKQRTEEVTIFGEKQSFLSGPLRIAIRCGASVLQAFIVPEKDFRYRFAIVEMLVDPDKMTDEDTAVAHAMRAYAANIERYVRASPALLSRP